MVSDMQKRIPQLRVSGEQNKAKDEISNPNWLLNSQDFQPQNLCCAFWLQLVVMTALKGPG